MDVDLVAQLNSTFYSNLSEKQKDDLGLSPASYDWPDFNLDVLQALKDCYSAQTITEGNKCIKVKGGSGRLPADVVVCARYLNYKNLSVCVEGMTFWTRNEHRQVINYPKIHLANGIKKHQNTTNRYKPTVRMFKNARNYLETHNHISPDLAPSYFLECLLYNVSDSNFSSSCQDTFYNAVNFLNGVDYEAFVAQNEQLALFGNTPEQWSVSSARNLVRALIQLWNDW
jgi:hypothetical protein